MERDREWLFPAIMIAMATALAAAVIKFATGYAGQPNGTTSLKVAIGVVVVTALLRFLRYLFDLWREGEDHPIGRATKDSSLAFLNLAPVVAGIAIIGLFLYSITFLKSMITAVIPFWADPLLEASDRTIYIDPQAMALTLKPALPALGLFYGLWHAVHLGGILWVLHWQYGDKARHILSFMLTWGIGMALAYVFSSAGPIFTGAYDPSTAPAITQKAAEFLWSNYQASGARIGGGISAFPSMHVALAAWFTLVLKDRGLQLIGLVYLLAVFFCSIVLGWHYAVDGAAGIGIALLGDRLSGLWIRRASIQQGIATATAAGASTA